MTKLLPQLPSRLLPHLSRLSACLLAGFVIVLAARGYGETTMLFVAGSLLMFACCWASAAHVLGPRDANRFVLVALCLGWVAEQLGATRGWIFGSYYYTDVLGPRLGAVPVIIPLMWFALCYAGYVIGNLAVWQAPRDQDAGPARDALMSLVGATVVTAYDLGADPYMVYKAKAWIMQVTDGGWFGETVQGFGGWFVVSFAILLTFRLVTRTRAGTQAPARAPALPVAPAPVTPRHALPPVAMYAALMVYQVVLGYPVETRSIALFAMGFPLLAAGCGLLRWRQALAAGVASSAVGPAAAIEVQPLPEAA